MAQNQNTVAAPIKMDSRKFLGALNESAQSKVAFFESKISEMGKSIGRNWRLASLRLKQINKDQQYVGDLFIEDVDTHQYYNAECRREKGGRVTIQDVRPIEIVEEDKQPLFVENCLKLVNSIEENNQQNMAAAFERMAGQRFSGRAVPLSGVVRTRDGVVRKINISSGASLNEDIKPAIVAAVLESVQGKVLVENGSVVSGNFSDEDALKLPVTKWASRKLVGKQMREAAREAYWSAGFQDRIYQLAQHIYEDQIPDAVKLASEFLLEYEEFTLLGRDEIKTLIENALAAKACFNQQLCEDTATLFHRTNLKVNKATILKEWKKVAKQAEHPTLLENVNILERSRNFEAAYDRFLEMIFEAISNREVTAEALSTTLAMLRDKTPKIRESHEMSARLNDLIARLKGKEMDDAAIYEAEDLIATIQEELSATQGLGDFDGIPGDDTGGTGSPLGATGATDPTSGAPVININSPLIQIGGNSSAAEGAEDAPLDLGTDQEEGGDLDELLGAEDPNAMGATPPAPAPAPGGGGTNFAGMNKPGPGMGLGESKETSGALLNDCDDDCDEDDDPYSFKPKAKKTKKVEEAVKPARSLLDYGEPAIPKGDLNQVVKVMQRLATERGLAGAQLGENLNKLAKASIEAVGLRLPPNKYNLGVNEAIETFSATMIDQPDEEEVVEDQFKGPVIKPRGLGRSSISKNKKTTAESRIVWAERESTGIAGSLNGVKFILDHGKDRGLAPVILSIDGQIEVPIPQQLHESALAAAKVARGNPAPFTRWLLEGIEQLRPETDEESRAIEEAVATITANADGSIQVSVDGDVAVDELPADGDLPLDGELPDDDLPPVDDDLAPEDEELPEGDLPPVDGDLPPDDDAGLPPADEEELTDELPPPEEGAEMKPVDAVVPPKRPAADAMPDFDDDESEEGFAEDKDITDPQNSKYTKEVKGNKREQPTRKLPPDADDELEGIGPSLKKDDGTGSVSPVKKS